MKILRWILLIGMAVILLMLMAAHGYCWFKYLRTLNPGYIGAWFLIIIPLMLATYEFNKLCFWKP